MAQELKRLTARFVETAKTPGKFSDGANLYLVVKPSGKKSWLFIYRFGGRQREMGLGSTLNVSLKAARDEAEAARALLGRGIDPLEWRVEQARTAAAQAAAEAARRAKATFGEFALDLLKGKSTIDEKGRPHRTAGLVDGYRNAKHRAQWESTLRQYAAPIWQMKVEEIGLHDVKRCLDPIWLTKHETARRVRGRIEAVLSAAIALGLHCGPNPAAWKGNIQAVALKTTKRTVRHHPRLPWASMSEFWRKLKPLDSVSADALRFTILTAARSGEVRGATWAEIDLDGALWTVPAERMKAGKEHVVPLSDVAVTLLKRVSAGRVTREPDEFVFPTKMKRKALSDMALLMCLRGVWQGITVHGFRSSFRDWCGNATDFPRELAEEALAHAVGDATERAYRRDTAIEKRRVLMQQWADFVTDASGNATAC